MEISKLTADLKRHGCNEEEIWDVLTALRGCDGGDFILKQCTTARIRGVLGLEGLFDTRSYPLDRDERAQRNDLLLYAPGHFIGHYNSAVKVIKDHYGWDLGTETRTATPVILPVIQPKKKIHHSKKKKPTAHRRRK